MGAGIGDASRWKAMGWGDGGDGGDGCECYTPSWWYRDVPNGLFNVKGLEWSGAFQRRYFSAISEGSEHLCFQFDQYLATICFPFAY